MRTYAMGWDFGNTESGGVLIAKGQQLKRSTPTAFVRVDIQAMQNLNGLQNADEIDKSRIIIKIKDESASFAFGDYALSQQGEPWNGRGDPLRYASRYALRGLLATAATLIPDREFALFVIAGLPAESYIKSPQLREEIKTKLGGTHLFTLDGEKTWRTAHVEVCGIIMEGAGALATQPGLNANSECGVIDIGGGTTDLYAQHGVVPITDLCRGRAVAVESATQLLKQRFLQEKKRELTDKEARDIMHAYVIAAKKKEKDYPQIYPPISAFGQPVSAKELHALVQKAIEIVAEEIVSFIASVWKDGIGRFNPILFIGGGTFYFLDAVKKRIAHVKSHEDPVFANAIGYATLAARRLLKRNQEAAAAAKAEAAAAALAPKGETEATVQAETTEAKAGTTQDKAEATQVQGTTEAGAALVAASTPQNES